jgi:hypothetical protein
VHAGIREPGPLKLVAVVAGIKSVVGLSPVFRDAGNRILDQPGTAKPLGQLDASREKPGVLYIAWLEVASGMQFLDGTNGL